MLLPARAFQIRILTCLSASPLRIKVTSQHMRDLYGDGYYAKLPKTINGISTVVIRIEQLPYALTFSGVAFIACFFIST